MAVSSRRLPVQGQPISFLFVLKGGNAETRAIVAIVSMQGAAETSAWKISTFTSPVNRSAKWPRNHIDIWRAGTWRAASKIEFYPDRTTRLNLRRLGRTSRARGCRSARRRRFPGRQMRRMCHHGCGVGHRVAPSVSATSPRRRVASPGSGNSRASLSSSNRKIAQGKQHYQALIARARRRCDVLRAILRDAHTIKPHSRSRLDENHRDTPASRRHHRAIRTWRGTVR